MAFTSLKKVKLQPGQWEDSSLHPLCSQRLEMCLTPISYESPNYFLFIYECMHAIIIFFSALENCHLSRHITDKMKCNIYLVQQNNFKA